MTVTFEVSEADVRAFVRHYHGKRYWRHFLPILGLLTLINVSLAYFNMPDKRAVAIPVAILFPLIVLPLLALIIKPALLALAVRRSLRDGTPKDMIGKHEVTLDGEAYHARSESSEGAVRWAAVHALEKTPAYIYFYRAPAMALPIPTRAFSHSDDASASFSFARESWQTATGKIA